MTEGHGLKSLPARYRVRGLLAHGAHKRVYLADDTRAGRTVAVSAVDLDAIALNEAKVAATLGEVPGVVPVYQTIEAPDAVYIVSRYLEGGDLATALMRDDAEPPDPLHIAAQLCAGLENIHRAGIVHRDLKPSNVLLDAAGSAYIGDFGLAAFAGAPPSHEPVGTAAYMPPEQALGESPRPASDLYALGCVLYELLTGRPPFYAETPAEIIDMHQSSVPDPPARSATSVAPLLNDLVLKLLAKDPAERPSSARDVRASLEGLLLAAGRTSDGAVVGRVELRAQLEEHIEQACTGSPSVVLIRGEAGIGKSRLLDEARRSVLARGGIALTGHGYEDAAIPGRQFADALLPICFTLAELPAEEAGDVRSLLYESDDEAEIGVQHEARRHRLFVSVFRALLRLCETRPVALILDDLQWSDSASLQIFERLTYALAERGEPARILLLGGYRSGEDVEAEGRLRALGEEEICDVLEPTGLNEGQTHDLLTELGVERPSQQLVRFIRERAGGNPLFIREVTKHLQEGGSLEVHGGSTVAPVGGAAKLPPSASGLIGRRLRELSDGCTALISLASLLGGRFDLHTLAHVSSRPAAELEGVLAEAVSTGLLLEEGTAYRFGHPLYRRAFVGEMDESTRTDLHLRIARRFESLDPMEPEARVLEIARHLCEAGALADPDDLLSYVTSASGLAIARSSWDETTRYALAAVGRFAEAEPTPALAELHRRAAFAYHNRFDRGPCLHHYDAAIGMFRALEDVPALARSLAEKLHANVQMDPLTYRELGDVGSLEALLPGLAGEHEHLRAEILGLLSESYWAASRPAQAQQLAEDAMRLSRELGDAALCARNSIPLASSQMQRLRMEDAIHSLREGADFARRGDSPLDVERCLNRAALYLVALGQLDTAEDLTSEIEAQVQDDVSVSLAVRAMLSSVRGDYAATERHAEQAAQLVQRAPYVWVLPMTLAALVYTRAMRDDWAGAHRAVDRLTELSPGFDAAGPLSFFARQLHRVVDFYSGDRSAAAQLTTELIPPAGKAYDFGLVQLLCVEAEFACSPGVLEAPEGLESALLLARARGVAFPSGWPVLLPRLLGMLAYKRRAWSDAEAHFKDALAIGERAGAEPELARARVEYAEMLTLRAESGDAERAADLLRTALPSLRSCCNAELENRARQLEEFHGR